MQTGRLWIVLLTAWFLHAAETPAIDDSLKQFAREVGAARKRKDADWMLQQYPKSKMPPAIYAGFEEALRYHFSDGNLVVKDVKVHSFASYHPDAPAPGIHAGRPLKFIAPPTHWVVLEVGSLGSTSGPVTGPTTSSKLEIPVAKIGGAWKPVGLTYAK